MRTNNKRFTTYRPIMQTSAGKSSVCIEISVYPIIRSNHQAITVLNILPLFPAESHLRVGGNIVGVSLTSRLELSERGIDLGHILIAKIHIHSVLFDAGNRRGAGDRDDSQGLGELAPGLETLRPADGKLGRCGTLLRGKLADLRRQL